MHLRFDIVPVILKQILSIFVRFYSLLIDPLDFDDFRIEREATIFDHID